MKLNKKVIRISFIVFLCLFIIILALFFLLINPKIEESSEDSFQSRSVTALLVVTEPNISIIRDGETIVIEDEEADVFVKDKVKTDENGTGYIIFSDNSLLALDQNTEIEIDAFSEKEDSFEIRIKQLLGRTWSRIESLVGKDTDYELETLNTVATVRGTSFGCDIKGEVTYCYTTGGTIELTLKNLVDILNKLTLEAGDGFENDDEKIKQINSYEELLELIKEAEFEDPRWQEFIECLDSQLSKLLEMEEDQIFNYLIDHRDVIDCGEVLGEEEVDEEEEQITTTTTKYIPPPEPPSISSVSTTIDEEMNSIRCLWSAENATNFDVSLGTSSGSNDLGGWLNTTGSEFTFSSVGLVSGTTYYCNVRARGAGGETGVITSEAYFDQASGYFYLPDDAYFDPCDDCLLTNRVHGSGDYSDIPLDHLRVRFYIKNTNNAYYDGSTWLSDTFWHNVALTEMVVTPRGFQFSKDMLITTSEILELHFILYNHISGRELSNVTTGAHT